MTLERRQMIPVARLHLVARASDIPGTRERLHIGDLVRLNSGGPSMVVVDFHGQNITAAISEYEITVPRPCLTLHRKGRG